MGISRLAKKIQNDYDKRVRAFQTKLIQTRLESALAGRPLCECDVEIRKPGESTDNAPVCTDCGLERVIVIARGCA